MLASDVLCGGVKTLTCVIMSYPFILAYIFLLVKNKNMDNTKLPRLLREKSYIVTSMLSELQAGLEGFKTRFCM